MNRSRLEAFSDGVFAVAATLLALNLTVAGPGNVHTLAHQLGHLWPAFVTYLISFFTIGIIWVNHHAILSNVRVVTRPLLFINLVLLAVTVTIPFVTATLADYLTEGGWNASVAAALYAGVFEVMSISFALLFEWILRHDECISDPLPGPAKNAARLRFYFGQVPYLVAFVVAFVSAPATVIITAVVAVYYVFERARPAPPTADPTAELGPGQLVVKPLLQRFLHAAMADTRQLEGGIWASDTDWTLMQPPRLTNGPGRGRYRREIGQNVGRSIARADVADAILAALADPSTIGHTVGIGY